MLSKIITKSSVYKPCISNLNRLLGSNNIEKMSTSAEEQTRLIELGKKASAYQAIDENVNKDVKVMGIGSGSTIVYAVERLAERVRSESLDILCIPSSFQVNYNFFK